ncbi:MAG TPA: UDP-N-acetylglucosamine 2-epimerase (non-hydrolyzing) [Firmicutes bacterium]|nr:UDP-N-acetylglucosamine 2-epimerase (non-hydrolyzing) [Bacillota bacterium]
MQPIKVMAIFGTRPEAIKMAPVVKQLKQEEDFKAVVTVTAQHREMLDQVLELFDIVPDYDLGIMSEAQTLSEIMVKCLSGLVEPIRAVAPDLVLVHGDTATTVAGALAAFYHRVAVGHVEAGLRTGEKYNPYPEEMNRRLTAVLADLHFSPTPNHRRNLIREGIDPGAIFVTGNTVIDALFEVIKVDHEFSDPLLASIPYDQYRVILVTAHRRENWGEPFRRIMRAVARIAREFPDVLVIFPVHMNPVVREPAKELLGALERVYLVDPVDYLTMANLMKRSYMILTDSGGLQEEAPSLGKPVLVLRSVTERPEGIEAGTLRLVGTDEDAIFAEASKLLKDSLEYSRMAQARNPYGDGRASKRIVDAIRYYFGRSPDPPQEFHPPSSLESIVTCPASRGNDRL